MLAPPSPQPWCKTSTERPHRASLCPLTHAGVTAAATPNPSRAPGDVPTAPALALPPPWGHLLPQALPLEPSRGCWAHTWGGDTSPHPCPWQEDAGDASASAAGGCLRAFPWQCRCLCGARSVPGAPGHREQDKAKDLWMGDPGAAAPGEDQCCHSPGRCGHTCELQEQRELLEEATKMGKDLKEQLRDLGLSSWSRGG